MINCYICILLGVVPEYQCAVKREAKKAQKEKDKPNSTTQSPTPKEIEIKVYPEIVKILNLR